MNNNKSKYYLPIGILNKTLYDSFVNIDLGLAQSLTIKKEYFVYLFRSFIWQVLPHYLSHLL